MNIFRIYFLLSILSSCMSLAFADLSRPWNNTSGGTLPTGCSHRSFYSAANKTTIGYIIYLPPHYDSSATSTVRYPVVYSLHGMSGTEWDNVALAATLQTDINNKTVIPMIMVFVNGHGNSFYADSKDGKIRCETSIISELLPHIDSTFNTIPDRAHRATHGVSMGGFGALMLAYKHFDCFGLAVSDIAALVNWDTLSQQQFDQNIPLGIFGNDSNYFNNNYSPFTFVKKNADTLKALGTKTHMADNPNDITMGPLYNYNKAMWNLLKSKGLYVEFDSTAGNGHAAVYSGASAESMLKFLSNNFTAATHITASKQHPITNSVKTPSACVGIGTGMFAIPTQWHTFTKEITVYSMLGKKLGRENIGGKTSLSMNSLSKRYGKSVLLFLPTTVKFHKSNAVQPLP